MSSSVQPSQTNANKWELAQRLSGEAKAPRQALKSIFKGVMQGLENAAHTTFEASMKKRVWSVVSPDKLKTLKEALMIEFCDKILGSFSEEDTNEMLEEHKRTGAVKNPLYCIQIGIAYHIKRELIIETIYNKANSMKKAWIPEIVDAVKKEGIQLPV